MSQPPSHDPPGGGATPPANGRVSKRFHPAILEFENDEDEGPEGGRRFLYRLNEDLERLARNLEQTDADVVVLFCARVVEATCRRAVAFARAEIGGGPDTHNLATNIEFLKARRLMPGLVVTWAHSLRLMGNAARHLLRPITQVDMQLATAFLEAYLEWFFCQYEFQLAQYHTESLYADAIDAPVFAPSAPIASLIAWLGTSPPALDGLVAASRDEGSVFHLSLVFATLTAEKLINNRRGAEAREVLETAARHHGTAADDIRWRQMMGLYHSRAGELDEAERWLTSDSEEFCADPETIGILGGVLKRRYVAAGKAGQGVLALRWLIRARAAYELGWEKSKRTSFYHGINTAALYLWTGELAAARSTAQHIDTRLGALRDKVLQAPERLRNAVDIWDELTLLEAWLILGRYEQARAGLVALVARGGQEDRQAFDVFLNQARHHLRTLRELGETVPPETYLDDAVGGSLEE